MGEQESGKGPFLPAEHQLYAAVQARLAAQQKEVKQKIILEIREKDAKLKQLLSEKEVLGVDLYNLQQELAKIQENIEKTAEGILSAQNEQKNADDIVAEIKSTYNKKNEEYQHTKRTVAELQLELDKLYAIVVQVDREKGEMEAKLAVSKRETSKAEETASNLEKEKVEQDLYINKLTEKIRKLEEQLALQSAQLGAQAKEAEMARETLAEASKEMESIAYSKKQYLNQWKSAVIATSKRDETLAMKDREVLAQREEVMALDGEASNYKKAIDKAHTENETLSSILNKNKTEVNFLEKQIQKFVERKTFLQQEQTKYQKLLEQTESDLSKVLYERKGLEEQVQQFQKEGDNIQNDIVKLEDQITQNLQLQKTLEKSAANTEGRAAKLKASIREKEIQISESQNELARIRVDTQNSIAHNNVLKGAVELVVAEMKEKDSLVERYEVEIRRRNDEIERKQSEVDRLNKKLDQLQSNMKEENMGPLEATIHNLTNEIAKKTKENSELQYYWLRSQTELVNLTKSMEKESEDIQQTKRQLSVLKQKQVRINSAFTAHEAEIKEMETNVKNLQVDMQNLNSLIAKNNRLQSILKEGNMDLENEFQNKLKEAEREAISMEYQLSDAKEEKQDILHDIVEAERLVMLWEKKIQLAKETIATLDPNIGAVEISQLKQEIMHLQSILSQLKKQKDSLQRELLLCTDRRSSVIVTGSSQLAKNTAIAKNVVQKKTSELTKKAKEAQRELQEVNRQLEDSENSQMKFEKILASLNKEVEDLAKQRHELEAALRIHELRKKRQFDLVTSSQKLTKKYAGELPDNKSLLTRELQKQEEQSRKIKMVLYTLMEDFPTFEPHLREVVGL